MFLSHIQEVKDHPVSEIACFIVTHTKSYMKGDLPRVYIVRSLCFTARFLTLKATHVPHTHSTTLKMRACSTAAVTGAAAGPEAGVLS